jgi:YceI-like domain
VRALLLILPGVLGYAQETPFNLQASGIEIHVGKTGLLSGAAGHEHWVDAPISSGSLSVDPPHVVFAVDTAKMTVRADSKVDAKTQAQIQKDMEDLALDIHSFPKITFESKRIEKFGDGWRVQGTLTLHGVSRIINLMVIKTGNIYRSHTSIKQTDFGIKPFSAGGGTVKVKDELEIDVRIVPGS